MAATKPAMFSPKWLCFGLGILGTAILAMFWMYPALLSLFGGRELQAAGGLTWSVPLLFLALLMTGWLMLGFMALLWPELIIKILPEFLKKGLENSLDSGPDSGLGGGSESADFQFKHGRQFVLNSLAGRVLIWPPFLFSLLLLMPILFANVIMSPWSAWLFSPIFRILAFAISAAFIAALLLRIFAPSVFSFINRNPGMDGEFGPGLFPITAIPFIGGLLTAIIAIMLMSITGLLPQSENISRLVQTTGRPDNGATPNPAGNNPDTKSRDKETKRKDVSNVQWEQHFLALMGENHVPVADAFSTPFATYFRIDQPGYIPGGKLGPPDKGYLGTIECAPDIAPKNNNSNSVAESARDAAEATNNSKPIVRRNPNCPRDLGQLWSAGSYVYDGTGNQLAGFEFKDNTHAYVVRAANGSQYLVFPEGGFGSKDNPAIKKYVPRYVFIRNNDPLGNVDGDDGSKMKIKPYIAGAPDLPVLIDHKTISDKDLYGGDDDYLPNIDEIISALDKIKKKSKRTVSDDIVIISRAALPIDGAEYKKRIEALAREIKRSRQASNATFIHLGFLPQICDAQTTGCEMLNRRSTIIYTPNPR